MNTITIINLILLFLSPFFAVLTNGIFRKLMAKFQNRKGPTIFQTFYDLIKLFKKERIEAHKSKNIIFYSGLFLSLFFIIILYLVFFGIIRFDYDFIFLGNFCLNH